MSYRTELPHRFMSKLTQHMMMKSIVGSSAATIAREELLSIQAINDFLNEGGHLSDKNNHGETALFLAVKFSNLKVLEFLLKKGADPNIETRYGSPLHVLGVTPGHPGIYNQMIALLLRFGADLESTDPQGLTPLDAALFRANQVLRGVDEWGGPRNTILHPVRAFLDNGAILTEYIRSNGRWAHPLQRIIVNEERRRTETELRQAIANHRLKMNAVSFGGRHPLSESRLAELEEGVLQCIIDKVEAMYASEMQLSTSRDVARSLFASDP